MNSNFVHKLLAYSHDSEPKANPELLENSKVSLKNKQLPILELPTDRPRSSIKIYTGASHSLVLNQEISNSLQSLKQLKGIDLPTQLLTTFSLLLNRYTEQKKLVIGTEIYTQQHLQSGIVPLELQEELNFSQLAFNIGKAIDNHTNLTIDNSDLFQVLFKFKSINNLYPEIGYLNEEKLRLDLILEIRENPDNLLCIFTYNRNLFKSQTIARLAGHWETLLRGIIANPEQKILDLPLLTAAEEKQILQTWNDTKTDNNPSHFCLHQLFEAQAQKTPEATALIFENQTLTYGELNNKANQLAAYLQELGVKPDVLVGICIERSIAMIIAILAVLKAGGAYVPLDPTYPVDRINYMLQDTQAGILLTQQSLNLDLDLAQQPITTIYLDKFLYNNNSSDNCPLVSQVTPNHLAYVIYTSGSTGKPKGVQIEHRTAVNVLMAMIDGKPGITAQDRLLSVTTICFDISVVEIFMPLSVGGQLILANRQLTVDGQKLSQTLEKFDITLMQATPVTWQLLLAAGWQGSPKLKILSGGEPLSKELGERLLSKCSELWNVYGPTEATIWSSAYQVKSLKTPISIGKPLSNVKYYILDSHLRPLPVGVPGELYIGGDCLARGYLKRPELTAAKFIFIPPQSPLNKVSRLEATAVGRGDRLYKTGDLARYLEDGTVDCLGRLDRQVKIRGFRVEIGEIETIILQYPDIKAAVVIDVDDVMGMKRLVAYLVIVGQAPVFKELRSFLQQQLPNYMIPSAFVTVDSLPQTLNGKIDRLALPPVDWSNLAVDDNYVPPRNSLEEKLVQIWENVLQFRPIGVTSNFKDLGGNSILAVSLIAEIEQTFQKTLTIEALSSLTTIERLAESLSLDKQEIDLPIFSSISPTQSKLLLTIVAGRDGNRNRPNSMMVQVRNGIKAPLFVCANAYEEIALLAQHLDPQRSFYFLESGYFALEGTNQQIQELAAYHIQDILAVQPQAPYFLCGYSFGGILAWEIARQLETLGKPANMLFILDTPGLQPSYQLYQHLDFTCRTNWNRLTRLFGVSKSFPTPNTKTNHNFEKLATPGRSRIKPVLFNTSNTSQPDSYVIKPYHLPVSLFVTTETSYYSFFSQKLKLLLFPRLGWQTSIAPQLEITKIQSDHFSLLQEPQVQALATKLDNCLAREAGE
jgi:amino acid adenylation domain-containing protein